MNRQELKVKQLIDVNNNPTACDIDIPTLHKRKPLLAIALTEDGQILPVYQNSKGYPVLYTREKYLKDVWRDWWYEEGKNLLEDDND